MMSNRFAKAHAMDGPRLESPAQDSHQMYGLTNIEEFHAAIVRNCPRLRMVTTVSVPILQHGEPYTPHHGKHRTDVSPHSAH